MSPKMTVRRAIFLFSFVFAAFLVIGYRFWYLQVNRSAHYQSLAKQDVLRKLPVPAPRGNIITSDGMVLATSKPAWNVYYLNQGVPLPKAEVNRLAHYLGKSPQTITQGIAHGLATLVSYDPIEIASDISPSQHTALAENVASLPNIQVRPVAIRSYPYGSLMGNLLGTLTTINPTQYAQLKNKGFSMTSLVGSLGLEQEYNVYLHGHAGGLYAEVNRHGQLVRLFGQDVPTPGDSLHLTINGNLEKTAQNALAYDMYVMKHANPALQAYSPSVNQGGVIAINPNNGDILAMASLPSYNPQKLLPNTPGQSKYMKKLGKTPGFSWLPIPISTPVSPGSIFKPIMAVSALASGTLTPTTQIFDPGHFPKDSAFGNWYAPGFGWLNIEQAIGLSDDVFFYTVGYDMGIHLIDKWLDKFLLNTLTGIDIPGEAKSTVPTPKILKSTTGYSWTWGWNLNTAIGQGIDHFTMIALARAEAAIANGGTLYKPHLVSKITAPDGKVVKKFKPVVQGRLDVPASVIHTVQVGMEMSAQDKNIKSGQSGTGYGAMAGIPVKVATKTGTAQVTGAPNNAFFITYGPMPHPTILVIVYVKAGNWGADSGFVARAIYDQYFKIKDPSAKTLFDTTFGKNFAWPYGYKPPAPKGP